MEQYKYKKVNGNIGISKSLSTYTIWSICGLSAAFGVLCMGEGICLFIRPAFLVRYLYPVTPVVWMVLCVSLSKIKWSNIIYPIIIAITLIVYIPTYVDNYRHEIETDRVCQETLTVMRENVKCDDMVVTNTSHFSWTIFNHYLPDLKVQTIEYGYNSWNYDYNFWLLWSEELSEDEILWLEGSGFKIEEVYLHGNIGSYSTNIYKLYLNSFE